MRIGVDGRDLADRAASGLRQSRGIARYASSLLDALVTAHPEHDWVVALPAGAPEPAVAGVGTPCAPAAPCCRPGCGHGGPATAGPGARGGVDVLWLPAPVPVAVSAGVPYVLTVHDLSTELRPRDLAPYPRLWSRLTRARRLAARAAP